MTAQAVAVPVTGTGAVLGTPGTYRGISIRDTTGAPNTVTLYDNTAGSGTVLATAQLAANASFLDVAPDGVRAGTGLFLTTTGAVVGSVRVG